MLGAPGEREECRTGVYLFCPQLLSLALCSRLWTWLSLEELQLQVCEDQAELWNSCAVDGARPRVSGVSGLIDVEQPEGD